MSRKPRRELLPQLSRSAWRRAAARGGQQLPALAAALAAGVLAGLPSALLIARLRIDVKGTARPLEAEL